ncbi:MAG TPA: hypothetical protein VMN56_14420 [Casimicrobiaceae bacterium]|nr:hypothetical protein [Casimicrobiaceae bacterium]
MSFELVLRFRGPRVETEEELVEIEDALFELLADGETWDGHEVGAQTRTISILTPDAPATLERIKPFLARAGLIGHVAAAARPLAGGVYTTLWPRDDDRASARR